MAYKSKVKQAEKMKEIYNRNKEHRVEYQRQYDLDHLEHRREHDRKKYLIKAEFRLFLRILLD